MKSVFNLPTEDDSVLLCELAPGEVARISEIDAHDAIGRRLLDLGFVPQTAVALVRRAPLGDPSVYELCGYQLCLRRTEAQRIRVTRTPPGATPTPRSQSNP